MGVIFNNNIYNVDFFNEDETLYKNYLIKRKDEDERDDDERKDDERRDDESRDNDERRNDDKEEDGKDERKEKEDKSEKGKSDSDKKEDNGNDGYSGSGYPDTGYSDNSGNVGIENAPQSSNNNQPLGTSYGSNGTPINLNQDYKPPEEPKNELTAKDVYSSKYFQIGAGVFVGLILLYFIIKYIRKHKKKPDLSKNFNANYTKSRDIIKHPDAESYSYDSKDGMSSLYRIESSDSMVKMFHSADITYEKNNNKMNNSTVTIPSPLATKNVAPLTAAHLMNNQKTPQGTELSITQSRSLQNLRLQSSSSSISSQDSRNTLNRRPNSSSFSANGSLKPRRRSRFNSSRTRSLSSSNYYMSSDFVMTPMITKKIPGLDRTMPPPSDDDFVDYPPTPLPESLDDIPYSDNPDIDSEDTDGIVPPEESYSKQLKQPLTPIQTKQISPVPSVTTSSIPSRPSPLPVQGHLPSQQTPPQTPARVQSQISPKSPRVQQSSPNRASPHPIPQPTSPIRIQSQPIPQPTSPTRLQSQPIPQPTSPTRASPHPIPQPTSPTRLQSQPIPQPTSPTRTSPHPIPQPTSPTRLQSQPIPQPTSPTRASPHPIPQPTSPTRLQSQPIPQPTSPTRISSHPIPQPTSPTRMQSQSIPSQRVVSQTPKSSYALPIKGMPPKPQPRVSSRISDAYPVSQSSVIEKQPSKKSFVNFDLPETKETSFEEEMMASFEKFSTSYDLESSLDHNVNNSRILFTKQVI